MPYTSYPSVGDLTTFLAGQGLDAPSNLEAIVKGVIAEFERGTGYKPFLAAAAAVTVTFDPPYRIKDYILDLEGAFATITAVEIDDDALTVTDDYLKLPLNAAIEDPVRGWDEIKFLYHPGSKPASVEVTGRRGLYLALPDDVYLGLFNEMAACAIPASMQGPSMVQRIKQGGVDIEFDNEAGRSKIDRWHKEFTDLKIAYRRIC